MKRSWRYGLLAAGLAFLPSVLIAGLSKNFKEWPSSPEAYFLTSAERSQWKQVKTDAQAQNFISDYFARRGPDFRKMLDERIAVADKYFSAGETRGSETLKGKVIIVFGPPSEVEQTQGSAQQDVGSGGANPNAMADTGGRGGTSVGNPLSSAGPGAAAFANSGSVEEPRFIFTYDADHAPKAIGKAFRVALKVYSAKDQRPTDAKDLDEKFDAVARATIVGGAPSGPAK